MDAPLKIYLDASDYGAFVSESSEVQSIFQYLVKMKSEGRIVLLFSYLTIIELFQDYPPQFYKHREQLADMLTELCGEHCFKFSYDDRAIWDDPYSSNGDWMPIHMEELFCPKKMEQIIQNAFVTSAVPPKDTPILTDVLREEIIEEAKARFQALRSPSMFFRYHFALMNGKNTLQSDFHKTSERLHEVLVYVYSQITAKDLQSLSIRDVMPKLHGKLPDYFFDILDAFIKRNFKVQHFQRSDTADFFHALYLPHNDLWRTDTHFARLLRIQKVPFYERIVPKLRDLPKRIEELLT